MKAMIFILSLVLCCLNPLTAQDFEYPLKDITKVLIGSKNSVMVKSHDQATLLIKELENEKNKTPKKAAGLKPIFQEGEDNTTYGVEIKKENTELIVTSLLNRRAAPFVLYLPAGIDLYVESLTTSDITINGFTSEVEVKNFKGEIILTNLTGPIVAENDKGNILVTFSSLNQSSPTSIVTVSGDIDIALPKDVQANIVSKIPTGEFYTDFDLNQTVERNPRTNARTVKGTLNNGGVELFIQNFNGNVYLRKLK